MGFESTEKAVIKNEYDYSNAIPKVEYIAYLIQYLDSVYRQFISLVEEDYEKNERLRYEYKEYLYKKSYSEDFKIIIDEKDYKDIICENFEKFNMAIESGNLKNINSLKIKMNLNFDRGKINNYEAYENSFLIDFKPYDIVFKRISNHNDENVNKIENNIKEILNKFPTLDCIFCDKR